MADPQSSSRSVESVIWNNDLLTEILVRLPPLSLVLFKSVSKRWLSLIKDAINPTFHRNLEPLSGLFLYKYSSDKNKFSYDFMPLDIRIPICISSLLVTKFTFGPEVQNVGILDSCNGLLLCHTLLSRELYVYNPSISNMFKVLPKPDNVTYYYYHHYSIFGGLKLAFDPTKSPHYKVIYVARLWASSVHIYTYSSETSNWSLREHRFPECSFLSFRYGVYWNDAIYWIQGSAEFFKLDIMNEHSVLTTLPTPLTLDGKVHYEYWFYESRGCLLLIGNDMPHFKCFTIFEKGNVYSEWSVKYIVDDIIAERLSIRKKIYCIVLGEREEDSFLVLQLGTKVVQHKIVSKALSTIYDLGPNDEVFRCFQFIPSLANV